MYLMVKKGQYTETDITNPLNSYGRHKLLAEDYIEKESKHYIIIRTNCVFSDDKKNFVSRLVENLKNGKEATIPDDEFVTPTYAPDLVEATLRLVENIGYGLRNIKTPIANLVGSCYSSRYEFALNIAEIFNCNPNLIKAVKSDSLNRPAKRPLLGGLNIDLAENLIGRDMIHYIDGLKILKKNM